MLISFHTFCLWLCNFIKQFLYSPKFKNYSEQRKKIPRLEFSKSLEVPNNDQRLVKTLIWLKFSNGVSSKKKKKKRKTPESVTYSKLKEFGILLT